MTAPPPTLMNLVQRSQHYLEQRGIGNARREAEWIFTHALHLSRLDLYTRFDMPLEEEQVQALRTLVSRRGKREPLAYILGTQPFRDFDLVVGPAVLVPRPETEELIDHILAATTAENPRVLDIGTGSGALAISLKAALPAATVFALDVSADAVAVAQHNAQRLEHQVHISCGDLGTSMCGGWDIIVANLPYIAHEERELCDPELQHEPALALFAENQGMALIIRLLQDLKRLLAPEGVCWLEHGFQQGQPVASAAQACGLQSSLIYDSADQERFTKVTFS